MQPAIELLDQHCARFDPGGVVGLYLYGSAVLYGLRPDSDLDLLLVTRAGLAPGERARLSRLLLDSSGATAVSGPSRPVELTVVTVDRLRPWTYPPLTDYQYGEWLRPAFDQDLQGPPPHPDPDLTVLLVSAAATSKPLRGVPLADLLDPVPATDVRRAIQDSLNALLGDLGGDERNVILTLCRMIVTLRTGLIVSKDQAAERVSPDLDTDQRAVVDRARAGYLSGGSEHWGDWQLSARRTARTLADLVRGG